MSTLSQDLRFAIRVLLANPGFSIVAVLSLAIGIGANSAIFSVASALLLRPLPYTNANRQVILWNTSPGLGIVEDWFSTAQYFDIRNGTQSFEDVAIAIGANSNLTGDGEPERVGTIRVSSNLLPLLGVRPLLGDLFGPDDDRPGKTGKALLGFGTWTARYGGDRNVIGRALTLNGQPYEVVGILPASFSLPREVMPTLGVVDDAEVVLPLPLAANAAEVRNREDYNIIATLKPGVAIAQARVELDALTARLRREHPDFYPPNGGLTFRVLPLQEQAVGRVRLALLVLAASVAFVLLIACANVANLLLSRALARQKEVAVRLALGASRWHIVRQFLTESLVLAFAGGLVGLLLSFFCLQGIRSLGEASVPRLHEIAIDWRVLLFTMAISVLAGAIFGLAPALRLSTLDLHGNLKDASRGSAGASAVWGRGQNLRRLLVVAELALSVMLLIGAGLLIRSFSQLQHVSPGFNPANVLTLELTMTGRKYNDADSVLQTYKQLWERLSALPGVTAAGGVSALPLSQMMAWGPITIEGRTAPEGEKFINADIRVVGGDYFRAMDIPLRQGRLFSQEHDTRTSPRVVVIDERMASQFWPGEDRDRQAHPYRRLRCHARHALDDDRGGRRRRETGCARRRLAHRVLPVPGPDALARDERRGAQRHRAVWCRGGGHRADPRARSRPADLQDADDGRARRGVARGAPVLDAAAVALRGAGARARRDRDLRSDGVSGEPGDARVGDPAGARRHPARRAPARRPAGHAGRGDGDGARPGVCVRPHALHACAPFRRAGERSRDVRGDRRDADARGARRLLRAGAPGGAD